MFRACFFKGTKKGLLGQLERFTRLWTRSPYSHMEVQFSDGMSASSVATDGGVRFKLIDYMAQADQWDFIVLPDTLENKAREWFKDHDGCAYDYIADLRFMLGFLRNGKDNFMCSESCMSALGFQEAFRFEPAASHVILERMFPQ